MSAYAALVSLLQILGTLRDRGRLLIANNRPQLQSLHEKAIFLLDFLDNSSTCKAALETKMREAAYKAEDLIEFHMSLILDSDGRSFRSSIHSSFRHFHFVAIVSILACNLFPASFTEIKAMPAPIQIFILRLVTPVLVAFVTCPTGAAFLHLCGLPLPAINFLQVQANQEFLRVLYDFDVIVKEVIQIKEMEMEMSAHAALIPLRQILDSNLDSGGCHNRGQLESLHKKVIFLLDFLVNAAEMETVEVKIREAVYRAKALIEFHIPAQFIMDSDRRSFWGLMKVSLPASLPFVPAFTIIILVYTNCVQLILASFQQVIPHWIRNYVAALIAVVVSFGAYVLCTIVFVLVFRFLESPNNSVEQDNQELSLVIDDFSVIVRNVVEIKDACRNPSDLPASAASSRWDLRGTERNVVVGLDGDLRKIKDLLARNSSKLEVVSIVGMSGIGKTTLAKQVYDDPYSVYKFDIRAWITVSHEHSICHVLLGLLDSAKKLTKEMQEENDDRLGQYLYQTLIGRTYLIVMDDMWCTEIWDSVRIYFPDSCNGSRVLLTSQLSNVASHPNSCSPLHQMQCLNANESWDLLREKAFGAETCPLELESIGREIARRCRGLPLAIVVIGGLLYKDSRSEIWRDIAKNLNSILRLSEQSYLGILGLSYNHLPHHLRPCFLYMGVFLGDGEIPVSRLFNLWVAEGILKRGKFETLEEVAEDNLKNLIDRNLVLVRKRSCNGKIRTCSMHGLLREFSQQKALKENFLHVVDRGRKVTRERRDENPRRLSIRSDALLVDARRDLISRYYNVRSFLCTSMLFDCQPVAYLDNFVYLRVLDVLVVHLSEFPEPIIRLLLLRYLALHYDGPLPPSMSKLQNLETIVHHHCSFHSYPLLPGVIWSMTNLRHLYVKPGCYLSNPLSFRLPWKSCALQHLQTLVGIRNFRWSQGMINRIPNLKKLGISYQVSSSVDWAAYQLESLVDLIQLESLKIIIKYNDEGSAIPNDPPKLAFPQKLKNLSLSGCGIPWASMTSIGALPDLEALKLRCEAFSGESWETVEGEFPQLIFLLLEDMSFRRWETEADHFPRLQRIVVTSCGLLEEIPPAVGDIPTLEMIHLVDCLPSAVDSAKQIQEDQQENGNEGLKVCIN